MTPVSAPNPADRKARASASTALPCLAIGCPSKVVATEDGSPGMLNRIEVVDPPKSAPQYMLVRRMIAETGFMLNVSGISSVTPFGAPSPGRTPTRMPSSTPTIISSTCCKVRATAKPWQSASRLAMVVSVESEPGFERPRQQGHLKPDRENDPHRDGD